jgi:hypothetical protein
VSPEQILAKTIYGVGFDNLAARWAWNENEHDRMHPDRGDCGGVGGCPMMRESVDLMQQMEDQLTKWRKNNRPLIAEVRRTGRLPADGWV